MKIITTANQADYHAWFARALVDADVWPFLSNSPRYCPIKIEDDDWERRVIMDDSGTGCCVLGFGRNGDKSVQICLWILSSQTRPLIAASLLRDAVSVASRYDVELIDSMCHGSNHLARKVHEKFFGRPWGVEPEGAWNGLLRKFEDRYCWRASTTSLQQRVKLEAAA